MTQPPRPVRTAIGLMSGTSMDGVDVAVLRTDGDRQVLSGPTGFLAYSPRDRDILRSALADAISLSDRTARPGTLSLAEQIVTERHAQAIEDLLVRGGLARPEIDLIGFHGQTVLHRPEQRLTVQIGDGPALARMVGIDVVHDFRAADVAAGGQGAPLVPVFHRALVMAGGLKGSVALVNIGGVANVTIVKDGAAHPIAGDTGPGNALIDDLTLMRTGRAMDADGALARQGAVDTTALADLLSNPFFKLPFPKSLDRNAFSLKPVAHLKTEDALATLVAFTATTIADAIRPYGPLADLIVCGGGAKNTFLMETLAQLSSARVQGANAFGWSADFMEAQAFAYLAVRSCDGLPLTYPSTTGVLSPMGGGVMYKFMR